MVIQKARVDLLGSESKKIKSILLMDTPREVVDLRGFELETISCIQPMGIQKELVAHHGSALKKIKFIQHTGIRRVQVGLRGTELSRHNNTLNCRSLRSQKLSFCSSVGLIVRPRKRGVEMIERLVGIALCTLVCSAASAQSLDERVSELERRVERLERQAGAMPPTSPAGISRPNSGQSDGWRQKENWRSLKRGMTQSDVRSILGEPSNVRSNVAFTMWEYPAGGSVQFDSESERLEGWSEPD